VQRVHWTPDLAEAHIVEGLLRAHGLQAWAFDTATIRQDWFRTLSYGGYRVVATAADAEQARELLGAWRTGALSLPSGETELPVCTVCHADAAEDQSPRRRIFLALIGADAAMAVALLLPWETGTLALLAIASLTPLGLAAPGLAAWLMRRRYRCVACGHAWREPASAEFLALADQVAAADAATETGARP
jgi:hypothetical protein